MSFFESELVQAELDEISILQEDIYKNAFEFPNMNKEEKLFHIGLMEKLLDKQQILYTRLKLSDDPEALEMKEKIHDTVKMLGFSPDSDMNVIFNSMSKLVELMKSRVDRMDSDL